MKTSIKRNSIKILLCLKSFTAIAILAKQTLVGLTNSISSNYDHKRTSSLSVLYLTSVSVSLQMHLSETN